MEEDPSGVDEAVDGDPDDPDTSTKAEEPDTPTGTEESPGSETEQEPEPATEQELPGSGTEEPPGSDPEARVSEEAEPDAEEGATGSPGMVPPKTDERTAPGGIPQTTTTGDPDKDVGGPSVTEESRRQMEGDDALDEPGYGDLGHAEDFRILRDD